MSGFTASPPFPANPEAERPDSRLACVHPASGYLDDQPAGWVAVEPRTAYPKLRTSRVPWSGRDEDKDDDGIWAVTCFVIRKGYRGRGLTYPPSRVPPSTSPARGARALEAYPMITQPGKEITWGEVHVGARQVPLTRIAITICNAIAPQTSTAIAACQPRASMITRYPAPARSGR